jgi:hypothetical protein
MRDYLQCLCIEFSCYSRYYYRRLFPPNILLALGMKNIASGFEDIQLCYLVLSLGFEARGRVVGCLLMTASEEGDGVLSSPVCESRSSVIRRCIVN